jgi:hypothetical protein
LLLFLLRLFFFIFIVFILRSPNHPRSPNDPMAVPKGQAGSPRSGSPPGLLGQYFAANSCVVAELQ